MGDTMPHPFSTTTFSFLQCSSLTEYYRGVDVTNNQMFLFQCQQKIPQKNIRDYFLLLLSSPLPSVTLTCKNYLFMAWGNIRGCIFSIGHPELSSSISMEVQYS